MKELWLGIPEGQCFGFLGINVCSRACSQRCAHAARLCLQGAGKTTTIRILTGDELPTSGTGKLNQLDILSHQREVRQIMGARNHTLAVSSLRQCSGYTPQFDALNEALTARETLTLFARIKVFEFQSRSRDRLTHVIFAQGIPEERIPAIVDNLIKRLTLSEFADRACGGYSGCASSR